MRLATIRTGDRTVAVRVDEDAAVEISSSDVGSLLAQPDWRQIAEVAAGTRYDLNNLSYAPLIPRPEKIICVGLNYRQHIEEMGRDAPKYPTLFAKYTSALIGAYDEIVLPDVSAQMDWETELAVVIGRPARHVSEAEALDYVAGYSVLGDTSARDYQNRTAQFLQGKTFEATTPLGPWLVTPDDGGVDPAGQAVTTELDGETMQQGSTADLIFPTPTLISYISDIVTLQPGDVIATGTPSGVGHGRKPPRYLQPGEVLVSRIAGIGECRNRCVAEQR
jgi:acylpyruvate hydrolase